MKEEGKRKLNLRCCTLFKNGEDARSTRLNLIVEWASSPFPVSRLPIIISPETSLKNK
jgi:hypothetical protein